jgi:hypothetical protein
MSTGIKSETWVICQHCDQVVEKTYGDLDQHGKLVHQAIKKHRIRHQNHTSYRAIPSPVVRSICND